MSKTVKREQPGVKTTVSAAVKTQLYIIAPSKEEYERLSEQVNEEHVTVFTPPRNGINISRRPADGEMMIDLREEDTEPGWVTAP